MKQFTVITSTLLTTLTLLTSCTIPISTDNVGEIGVITQPVPVAVPIIIDINTRSTDNKKDTTEKKDKSVYMCKLNAFTSTYQAEDTNRGKARLNVKKQCLNQFNEMFCRDKDITCVEYN